MQKVLPIVQFSSPAREKLKEALKEQNTANAFLRIDVYAAGGCACSGGYKYGMGLEDKARPDDVIEEIDRSGGEDTAGVGLRLSARRAYRPRLDRSAVACGPRQGGLNHFAVSYSSVSDRRSTFCFISSS